MAFNPKDPTDPTLLATAAELNDIEPEESEFTYFHPRLLTKEVWEYALLVAAEKSELTLFDVSDMIDASSMRHTGMQFQGLVSDMTSAYYSRNVVVHRALNIVLCPWALKLAEYFVGGEDPLPNGRADVKLTGPRDDPFLASSIEEYTRLQPLGWQHGYVRNARSYYTHTIAGWAERKHRPAGASGTTTRYPLGSFGLPPALSPDEQALVISYYSQPWYGRAFDRLAGRRPRLRR